MNFQSQNLELLLQRTNLQIPFGDFLQHIEKTYPIGKIQDFSPVTEGYQEANIKITTPKGNYYIKIFSKDRSVERTRGLIESSVKVLREAEDNNIQLVRLVEGNEGYFGIVQKETAPVFYYLTHAFEGDDFSTMKPSSEDIVSVTQEIAKLNTLMFPIVPGYDSWGNKNLVYEYDQTKETISQEIKDLITPTVEEMSKLDDTQFGKSIIHGDIQRKHVLKNKKGEYGLLDLSCMRNDAKAYDLSTHLAWFCLAEDTWDDKEKIVDEVLHEYTKIHTLSKEELTSLPLLVRASYASYLRKTAFLIAKGDVSKETKTWFNLSRRMLELFSKWDLKL